MKNYQMTVRLIALSLSLIMVLLSFSGCGEEKKKPLKAEIKDSQTKEPDDTNVGNEESEEVDSVIIPGSDSDSDFSDDETMVVKVSDYGAVPNDSKDDGEAIRRAFGIAGSTRENVTVELDEGIYNIASADANSPKNTYHAFYIQDAYNVTIKGNDTTIMLDDPFLSGFYFTGGGDISIDGITIDYSIDPWAQGTVTAIDTAKKTFTIKVNNLKNGKSVLDDARWYTLRTNRADTSPFGMVRDDDNPKLFKQGVGNYFCGFTAPDKIAEATYTIGINADKGFQSWIGTNIKIGSKLVLNNRIDSCGAFRFVYFNGDATITNCKVYASVGTICCIGTINGDLTINNLKVLLTGNRWVSNNADGFYMSNIAGKVKITNCIIEGLSDDCVNLFVKGQYISEVISTTKIKAVGKQVPEIGDKITVIDPVYGTVKGTATVVDSVTAGDGDGLRTDTAVELTLDDVISGMLAGNANTPRDIVIRHEVQSLGSVFENNTFRYGRAKGIKINTRNTLISGNTFENIGYAGVTFHDIPALWENSGVDKVIVQNNTFKNCGYLLDRTNNETAAISIYGMTFGGKNPAMSYIHSNIKILNNSIENVFRNGIYISNAAKLTITGNKITGFVSDGDKASSGIMLGRVKQAKINGNTFTDPRKLAAAVSITASARKNITYKDNEFTLASGVTQVDDKRDADNR